MKINTYNHQMMYEQIIRVTLNQNEHFYFFFFFILKLDILTKLERKTNIACEVQWCNKS